MNKILLTHFFKTGLLQVYTKPESSTDRMFARNKNQMIAIFFMCVASFLLATVESWIHIFRPAPTFISSKKVAEFPNGMCLELCCVTKGQPLDYDWSIDSIRPVDRFGVVEAKMMAELHYGSIEPPNGRIFNELTSAMIPCIQNGTVIYVDKRDLQHFIEKTVPKINPSVRIVLVIGGEGGPVSPAVLSKHILGNHIFAKVFSNHCITQFETTSQYECFPLGISAKQEIMDGINSLWENNVPLMPKQYSVLVESDARDSVTGISAYKYLCATPDAKCLKERQPALKSLEFITRSKFVAVPKYGDQDSHRVWEVLAMGSFPIVLKSPQDNMYSNLPILIVKAWSEVDKELIDAKFDLFTSIAWDWSLLYSKTFQEYFMQYRQSPNSRFNYFATLSTPRDANGIF